MKLLVYSDLHLEFSPFAPPTKALEEADAVILAGDICADQSAMAWARGSFGDKPVIYVAGCTELLKGNLWDETIGRLREQAAAFDVHFLENESVTIADTTFLGCTLWTDFKLHGESMQEEMMHLASLHMPDFHADGEDGQTTAMKPSLWLQKHEASRQWLERRLRMAQASKTVVVTHHAPHMESVRRFTKLRPLYAPAYASTLPLDTLLGAGLWIHGGVHSSNCYQFRSEDQLTRIVSNPRGNPSNTSGHHACNAQFNDALIVDTERQKSQSRDSTRCVYEGAARKRSFPQIDQRSLARPAL